MDVIITIVLTIGVSITPFAINYVKIIVILKYSRIIEFDHLFLRRLTIHRRLKVTYVLFQQVVIIFVLSHIIGVIYYWIDFALISTSQCENNLSRKSIYM